MTKIILINDVHSEIETEVDCFLVGSSNCPISNLGAKQASQVAEFLSRVCPVFDVILASDASRLTKLLHQIRLKCKVKTPAIRYSPMLRERDFGILNCTHFISGYKSDLFTHPRICSEGGETVSQCAMRGMAFLKNNINGGVKSLLCVSHPFLCQIMFNCMFNKKHTIMTKFWLQKGAIATLSFTDKGFRVDECWNSIDETQYADIYSTTI